METCSVWTPSFEIQMTGTRNLWAQNRMRLNMKERRHQRSHEKEFLRQI